MENPVTFHDHKPRTLSLHDAVVEGLSRRPKAIPPKFFYDEEGSKLFDEICQQPEYYLPDAEREILTTRADEIAKLTGTGRVVVEPGAGAAEKIRWLLRALEPAAYIPMDISGDYLRTAAEELAGDHPWLRVHAACVDFTHSLPVPSVAPEGPRLAFFPGSSLGNFEPQQAARFLCDLHDLVRGDGMLLIGVDTKKKAAVLDAAYNDAAGVTAAFNLNLLRRMRRELRADCDPATFDHLAFYNADLGRVEMHLVSLADQEVRINGNRFLFAAGERMHTECSYKYAPDEFIALAELAGFSLVRHWVADERMFAVYLFQAADAFR